MIVGDGD
jgi:hypothetical protein